MNPRFKYPRDEAYAFFECWTKNVPPADPESVLRIVREILSENDSIFEKWSRPFWMHLAKAFGHASNLASKRIEDIEEKIRRLSEMIDIQYSRLEGSSSPRLNSRLQKKIEDKYKEIQEVREKKREIMGRGFQTSDQIEKHNLKEEWSTFRALLRSKIADLRLLLKEREEIGVSRERILVAEATYSFRKKRKKLGEERGNLAYVLEGFIALWKWKSGTQRKRSLAHFPNPSSFNRTHPIFNDPRRGCGEVPSEWIES